MGIEPLSRLWGTGSPAALYRVDDAVMGKGDRSSIWKRLRTNCSISSVHLLPAPDVLVVPLDPEPQLNLHHLGLRRFRHRTPDLDLWEARKVRPIDGLEELPTLG